MATTITKPSSPRVHGLKALYASTAVSSLGDGIFVAAVPLATAALTRDPTAVAVVSASEMVPWLVVTPVAGALVDRWRHRVTMIVADLARGGLLALLTVLVFTGAASVPVLAAVACVVMIGTIFFDTASQAVIADLAHRDPATLNRANGVMSSTSRTGDLVGPPVGSAVFALLSWVPFALNGLSFVVSAAFVACLPRTTKGQQKDGEEQLPLGKAIAEGARWLARHRQLRTLCLAIAVANLAYSAALSTFVLYAQEDLGVSTAGYGLLLSAGAVGGIAGGFVAAPILGRLGDLKSLTAGILAQALAWAAIAMTNTPVVAGVAMALASLGTAITTVVVVGARQRLTPPEMLGRVTATFRTLGVGALPAGAAAGGVLASAWGLKAPLIAAAALVLALLIPVLITQPGEQPTE